VARLAQRNLGFVPPSSGGFESRVVVAVPTIWRVVALTTSLLRPANILSTGRRRYEDNTVDSTERECKEMVGVEMLEKCGTSWKISANEYRYDNP
jgi:hypothetical protein